MKKNNYMGWFLFPVLVLSTASAYADQSFWQDMSVALKSTATEDSNAFQHRRLQLQESQLKALISQTQYQTSSAEISLSLPLPDGGFVQVTLVPVPLFADSAQGTHPDFLTWRIESNDKTITSGRAELTELGFHAMLRTHDGDQILIEPKQRETSPAARSYHSHSRQKNATLSNTGQRFSCGVLNTPEMEWQQSILNDTPDIYAKQVAQRAGEKLLTYDLAMAATGEYTQKAGGTKKAALSAMTITVNRVNEIFERELSISLRLVTGTDKDTTERDTVVSRIIFTDPATDPYTNGSASLLLLENQAQLDKIIKTENYDIGHVLGIASGGDGLASLRSVCGDRRAQGTTSSSFDLLSDAFAIDFVAHELGHQLGATHTFNANNSGSCSSSNRTASTAYEPGSGSTIMSYAGICGNNDFQDNVAPHMHSKSIEQILNFTHNGSAASCATTTSINNKLPTVNAGANYTIPARTPFILQGSASDSDGNSLLYSWDQIDTGSASSLGVDTVNNALIKSSPLSASGIRNIPDITALLSQSQTTSRGESLPRSNRTLNFRLAVRDGEKGIGGGVGYDDTSLNVTDTRQRFEILSPGSNVSAGTQTIRWNVAATDQSPINCSHVDIAYTNDQGKTFTNVLLKTPNDGSASIQLSKTAQRIRVKCNGNIFFALSGTKPHIASYLGDSSQNSDAADSSDNGNVDNGGDSNNDDGGGGSLPTELLLITSLIALIRRYSAIQKREHS